jgi:hypothetical protein
VWPSDVECRERSRDVLATFKNCFFVDRPGIIRRPMADSRPLLDRLLNTPDLAKVVPHLGPDVLHRVIQRCGLEDCAELVAFVTPEQFSGILDVDLWRVRAPGAAEAFDEDRFGVWIDVLVHAGASVAAEKLIGLDIELAITGFSRLADVFEHAAASSFTTLDGEQCAGRAPHEGLSVEIGGYVIEARRRPAWDAIVELLVFLDAEHPEYFHRVMRRCVRLSNGPREAEGSSPLLDDRDQGLFDLACGREERREQQGYVPPVQARGVSAGGASAPARCGPAAAEPGCARLFPRVCVDHARRRRGASWASALVAGINRC